MSEMDQKRRELADRERTFYVNCLTAEAVPSRQRPFYIMRLTEFLRSVGERDVRALDDHEIADLLQSFARREYLRDWQYAQMVDAVRIYFVRCLKSAASVRIDWTWWMSSARSLQPDHPSLAREARPDEPVQQKIARGTNEFEKVRDLHADLLLRLVTEIRSRGYAYRTEKAYEHWVCRFIAYCGTSPEESGSAAVTRFLDELVVARNVSASTQNQALNALVFLYKRVLNTPLGTLESYARSKRKVTVPVVLTRSEVKRPLGEMNGWQRELASLLYENGMRLGEGLTLRIKDVDFDYGRIHVCQAKGKKDRFVPLPGQLVEALQTRIDTVAALHLQDLDAGYGEVLLPEALARKYPKAAFELKWQFLYPSARLPVDPRSGKVRRHHLHESSLQRGVKAADCRSGCLPSNHGASVAWQRASRAGARRPPLTQSWLDEADDEPGEREMPPHAEALGLTAEPTIAACCTALCINVDVVIGRPMSPPVASGYAE